MRFFGYDIIKAKDADNIAAQTVRLNPLFNSLGIGPEGINTQSSVGQAKAYSACSVLTSVIAKKVGAIKNMRLAATDEEGNDMKQPEAVKRMSRPNQYQRIEEFVANVCLMVNVFGYAYIFKLDSLGIEDAFELYVVPNLCVTANEQALQGISFAPEGNIKDYTVTIGSMQIKVDPENMFVVHDTTCDMNAIGGRGVSRLVPLQKQINTFIASYDATHELMVNRGMLAIISLTTGSNNIIQDVTLPQTKSEKETVQNSLSGYGIISGKMKYALTAMNAAVHPVSSTITDLGLTDVQRSSKKDIADIYQVPSVLLDVEGSTYANAKEAKTILYNDAVIPEANNIFYTLNKIYGFEGFSVMPYYDHLELFQEAKRQQATGMTNLVNALTNAVSGGLLNQNEARDELMKYIV